MSAYRRLIVILLIAAAVRFYGLGRASFWYDEFGSLEASTGRGLAQLRLRANQIIAHPTDLTSLQDAPPFWKIWSSLDLDNHPPLYFLVLRFTRDVLGDSEWTVRLPSAVFSLVAVIFFYLIVRAQLNEKGALAATSLMAIAGSQVSLAQEARPYSMWMALSLVCGWLIWRFTPSSCTQAPGERSRTGEGGGGGDERILNAERRTLNNPHPIPPRFDFAHQGPEYEGKKKIVELWFAIFFCLIALASLLTHILAAAILFSLFLFAAFRLRNRSRVLLSIVIATMVFAGIWGPFLLRQLHSASVNNAWQYDANPHHTARIFLHLMQLPARWLSEPAADFVPSAIFIFAIFFYAAIRCRQQRGMSFWCLWSIPLIALITATDFTRHAQSLLFTRYTFVAAPALCFLAGAFLQNVRFGWLLPAALGILCLATLPEAYSKVYDWRNVAADLREHVKPGDTIIFTPGGYPISWSQSTLLGIWHYAPELPASALILTDPNSALLSSAFRPGHMTWIICFNQYLPANNLNPAAAIVRTGIAPSMGRVSELRP
ncbi:MAG TPA: glycosyltransferase family 39 protein [Tepidisphaeraceae bacterium]|jgi:hypothetical protein